MWCWRGTGSGYQAAILSKLVKRVYSVKSSPLADQAGALVREMKLENIEVRSGVWLRGWPKHAPTMQSSSRQAASHVPPPLLRQLKPGGRMVIPVGGGFATQQLVFIHKGLDGKGNHASMPVCLFRLREMSDSRGDRTRALAGSGFLLSARRSLTSAFGAAAFHIQWQHFAAMIISQARLATAQAERSSRLCGPGWKSGSYSGSYSSRHCSHYGRYRLSRRTTPPAESPGNRGTAAAGDSGDDGFDLLGAVSSRDGYRLGVCERRWKNLRPLSWRSCRCRGVGAIGMLLVLSFVVPPGLKISPYKPFVAGPARSGARGRRGASFSAGPGSCVESPLAPLRFAPVS